MPKITQNHINKALDISKKSPVNKKFGALLIYNGRIISKGYNYHRNWLTDNVSQCLLCS